MNFRQIAGRTIGLVPQAVDQSRQRKIPQRLSEGDSPKAATAICILCTFAVVHMKQRFAFTMTLAIVIETHDTRASLRNVDFASPHVALSAKANCHDETVPFSAALILVASSNVHATEALIFDAGSVQHPDFNRDDG